MDEKLTRAITFFERCKEAAHNEGLEFEFLLSVFEELNVDPDKLSSAAAHAYYEWDL